MGEKLLDSAIYVASCGERNSIELYVNQNGYEWKCQEHNRQTIYKVLFLSPKGEVEGFFGPRYFCADCVPDILKAAENQDAYLDVLYGKFNQT